MAPFSKLIYGVKNRWHATRSGSLSRRDFRRLVYALTCAYLLALVTVVGLELRRSHQASFSAVERLIAVEGRSISENAAQHIERVFNHLDYLDSEVHNPAGAAEVVRGLSPNDLENLAGANPGVQNFFVVDANGSLLFDRAGPPVVPSSLADHPAIKPFLENEAADGPFHRHGACVFDPNNTNAVCKPTDLIENAASHRRDCCRGRSGGHRSGWI